MLLRNLEPARIDPQALALQALGWTLQDDARAERLLALTGLDAATLRASLGQPDTLRGVLDFVAGHEPDLVACADALQVKPEQLLAARDAL